MIRDFDEFISQLKSIELDLENELDPHTVFSRLLGELKKRGLHFPKPLIDAIEYLGGRDFAAQIAKEPQNWKELLIEFLIGNRIFLEPVYKSGRFLPPIESFDSASSKIQCVYINMIRRLRAAGINVRPLISFYHGRTDVVTLLIPVSSRENHLIALTVRRRRWYIPPSKADQNIRELMRSARKALRGINIGERRKIINETYILIGRYTKGVKGRIVSKGCKDGLKARRGFLVFRGPDWIFRLVSFLRNLFEKRLSQLRAGTEKLYGYLAEMENFLSIYVNYLSEERKIANIVGSICSR